jgi:hypothetical protein
MNLGERQISLEPGSASNELKSARMHFETRYTYDFVKRLLPSETGRILQVPCGVIVQAFAEQEERLAADGSIVPLGRRFVGVR